MKEKEPEKTCVSCYDGFRQSLDSMFQDNIPFEAVKELNRFQFVLFFGILLYVVYYGLFGYFMWSAYESSSGTKYISLENGPGCSTVPITISGSFLADSKGNWIGEEDFLYSNAAFELVLTSFSVKSKDKYEDMIVAYQKSIEEISVKSKEVGLIYTLLAWMSFVRYFSVEFPDLVTDFESVGYGNLQYMQLTGTPSAVFNLRWTQFALGSQSGLCVPYAKAYSDPEIFLLQASYNWTEFNADPICTEALIPQAFDLYSVQNNKFTFSLDTRSFSTAMAVNYGIIQLSELAPIANSYHNISVEGVNYTMAQYFDTRYAAMDPIACYKNTTPADLGRFHNSQLCFIIKGPYTLGLPLFNHLGTSYWSTKPGYCEGVEDASCDQFKLMSGILVYHSNDTSDSSVYDVVLLQKQMQGMISMLLRSNYSNYADFNRASYNASFIVSSAQNWGFEAQYNTPEYWSKSFEFCRRDSSDPNSQTCSLLMFNQYEYSWDFVSDYHHRLEKISRDGGIETNSSLWDKMKDKSPVSLLEGYYECQPTEADTLQNSQGIASGNIDMTMKVLIFILAPVVYFLLYRQNQEPEEEDFHKDHKEELSDMLMNLLLRSMRVAKNIISNRDNGNGAGLISGDASTPAIKGVSGDGVILKLGEELYNFSQFKEDKEEENKEEERVVHRCFKKAPKTRGNLLKRAEARSIGRNKELTRAKPRNSQDWKDETPLPASFEIGSGEVDSNNTGV